MKKFTILTVLAVFFFGFTNLNAQSIAHVNSEEILMAMTEYQTAQTQMQAEGERHRKEVERQQTEMKTIYDNAVKEMEAAKSKSEDEKRKIAEKLQNVEQDLQAKQQSLATYQQKASEDLGKMEKELVEPIYTKVQNAINAVASKKGIGYVFDLVVAATSGNMVYHQGGTDITNDVKTELGIK